VAMDSSKSALCNLKKIFREFNIDLENIELVHGDITFPENYLNNSFDILVDNYSLCANSAINIRRAYLQYYHLLSRGGLFLTNYFGKKTTGFNTGIKIDNNTFRNIEKGVLKDKGITTFWEREELNNMFKKIGYQIVKIENVVENRNSIFIEKHITYLMK
jgi:ubiquinone/menaquinone biosynthesis C-methylase UbiE